MASLSWCLWRPRSDPAFLLSCSHHLFGRLLSAHQHRTHAGMLDPKSDQGCSYPAPCKAAYNRSIGPLPMRSLLRQRTTTDSHAEC